MHDRQRNDPLSPRRPGFGGRLLVALLTGADRALAEAHAETDERASDDDQCRLRPGYSRQTRGHPEF